MKFTSLIAAAGILSTAAIAAPTGTLNQCEVNELYVLFEDILGHEQQYLRYLLTSHVPVPVGLIPYVEDAVAATDDSYTTALSTVPYSLYSSADHLLTQVPWYSTRIAPSLSASCTATSTATP